MSKFKISFFWTCGEHRNTELFLFCLKNMYLLEGFMSAFQFNEEPFFIEFCLLVMPIREPVRAFRWRLDLFDPSSMGMKNRLYCFDLKETVWDHIHMLLDLPVPRNLACNFCTTSDMDFFPQTNLWSHILEDRDGPCQGRVASCTVSQRPPASPLLDLLEPALKELYFLLLIPENQAGGWTRDCFSDRLARHFLYFTVYKKHSFP